MPFNATGSDALPMTEFVASCRANGLWPFTHFNRTHVVPPCTISADEVLEGIAILDEALTLADRYYSGAGRACGRVAEQGFEVHPFLYGMAFEQIGPLGRYPEGRELFFPENRLIEVGETLKQPWTNGLYVDGVQLWARAGRFLRNLPKPGGRDFGLDIETSVHTPRFGGPSMSSLLGGGLSYYCEADIDEDPTQRGRGPWRTPRDRQPLELPLG